MSLGDSASIILGRARGLARPYERRIAKEFAVPLHCNGASGCYTASILKPVIDRVSRSEWGGSHHLRDNCKQGRSKPFSRVELSIDRAIGGGMGRRTKALLAAFIIGVPIFILFVPVFPYPNPCPTFTGLVSCPGANQSISLHYFGVGGVNTQLCGYLLAWNGPPLTTFPACNPKYLP